MADNEATVKFTGDNAQMLKAFQELEQKYEKLEAKMRDGMKTSRAAAAEERKHQAEAARIMKENESAVDKYNRKRAELDGHLRNNRISQEAFNAELKKAQGELAKEEQKVRESTAAYQERHRAIMQAIEEQTAAQDEADRKEKLRVNTDATLKLMQIRKSEMDAIEAKDKAAADAQKKRNIDALLLLQKIRESELAAVESRQQGESDAQKSKNIEALKKLHAIRNSELAAALKRIEAEKDLQDAEEERGRRSAQIYAQTRSPLETYNARVRELSDLYRRGKIDLETYNRALVQQREILRGASQSGGVYQAMLSRVVGYIGVGGLVMQGLSMWKQANAELIQQAGELGQKYDEINRKFAVQSGMRGLQLKEAQDSITGIAMDLAVPRDQAMAAATQLVSSGFSNEEASGPALRAFLETTSASTIRGKNIDPSQLALSFSQFLAANNLDRTGKNVSEVGRAAQALFKEGNLEVSGMSQLAGASNAISRLTPWQDQLAAFTTLVESMPEADAATGLRNVVSRLGSSAVSKPRKRALKRIGLTPDDVDLTGEDLVESLTRIQGGLQTVPEKDRDDILKEMFEEQGAEAAGALLNNIPTIQKYRAAQNNQQEFDDDLNMATTGRSAAAVRQQITEELGVQSQDQFDDRIAQELENQMRAQGMNAFEQAKSKMWFSMYRNFGASPEASMNWALPFSSESLGQAHQVTPESIRQGVNRNAGEELIPSFGQLQKSIDGLTDAMVKLREDGNENSRKQVVVSEQTAEKVANATRAALNAAGRKESPLVQQNRGNR